jgi:hypothetical protein
VNELQDVFHQAAPWTELAIRSAGSTTVALLWSRSTDRLRVTVEDTACGDFFELVVGKDERPLDVFHHPYAYAATRRLRLERLWERARRSSVAECADSDL